MRNKRPFVNPSRRGARPVHTTPDRGQRRANLIRGGADTRPPANTTKVGLRGSK